MTLDVSDLALSNSGKTVYIGFGMGANGTPGDTATLIDKVEFIGP